MADIDYDILAEKLSVAIVKAMSTESEAKVKAEQLAQENKQRAEAVKEYFKLNKALKDQSSKLSALERVLLNQRASFNNVEKVVEDLTREIERDEEALKGFGDTIDESTRAAQQFELQQKIAQREQEIATAKAANFSIAISNASLGAIKFATDLTTNVAQAGAGLARSLQRGGSGIEASTGVLKAGVDVVNSGAQGLSGALTGAGAAAMAAGGKLKWFGVALTGLGTALGFVSNAAAETAKFGLELLKDEIQKTIDAYNSAAMAGAIFVNGATDLRNAAGEAGISVVTLSNIIKNNADAMYYSGMNIGLATKKISSAFAAGGDSFKKTLFNLGYSAEEQGALVAESMKYLSVAGVNIRNLTGGDVANATREYAVNLKAIAAITGDDAKKRMEQAREASANAAVQAKLAQMDPKMRDQFMKDLAVVPPALRNAVLQQRVLGTVTDRNANILMAMIPGMDAGVRGMSESLGQGAAVMGQYREAMAQNVQEAHARGDTEALGIVSLVGLTGAAADASNTLSTLTLEFQKGSKQAGDTAESMSTIEKMAKTIDPLTTSMSELQIQSGKLAAELEKVVTEFLPQFGTVLSAVNEQMISMIREAGEYIKKLKAEQDGKAGGPQPPEKEDTSFFRAPTKNELRAVTGLLGGIAGAGGASLIAPGPGTYAGAAGGAYMGQEVGSFLAELFKLKGSESRDKDKAAGKPDTSMVDTIKGWFNSNTAKNARGGITQAGKLNIAGEAGPEAIVPLESGAIPVTIDMLQAGDTGDAEPQLITPEEISNLYAKFAVSVSDLSNSLKLTDNLTEKLHSNLTNSSENIVNTTIQAADELHSSFVNELGAFTKAVGNENELYGSFISELNSFTKAVGNANDMLLNNFSSTEDYIESILQKFTSEVKKSSSIDTPSATRQPKLSIEVENKDNAEESFDVEDFVNRLAIINEKQRIELVTAIKDLTGNNDRIPVTDAVEYKKIIDGASTNFLKNLTGTEDYVDSITQKFVTDANREFLNTLSGIESSISDIASKMNEDSNRSFERNLSQAGNYFVGLTQQFVGEANNLVKNITGTETNVGTTVQKFLSDASNNFTDGLSSAKNFIGGLVKSIGDIGIVKQVIGDKNQTNTATDRRDTEAVPASTSMLLPGRPEKLGEVLSSYFDLKVNEIRPDREMVSELKDEMSTKLTELTTEIKNNLTQSKDRANESTNQFGRSETSIIAESLNASSRDLKETIMLQNKLLEENIQLSRELISVANDTRNYSQAIANNTL